MGQLIGSHDWAGTPLGPTHSWSQSLRTAVRLMLTTRHPVFIFWGADHRCLYNDAYAASLGPEKHPSILGIPAEAVWPEAWPIIEPQLTQVMTRGEATWNEDHLVPVIRHGRRQDVWWTYSYSPIDDEGAPNGIGGVLVLCAETTERVLSRRSLEHRSAASEAKYRTLFEAIDEGFCVIEMMFDDADRPFNYRILEQNPAFERHTGLTGAVGRTMLDMIPDAEPHWFEIYGRVALTGEPARFQQGAAGLGGRWFDVFAFRIGPAEARHVAVLFNDITARTRTEAALRDSEAKLRLIVENARDYAIFTTDAEDRIETWLPGAENVFGWTAGEAVGRRADIIFTPEDRAAGVPQGEIALARETGVAPNNRRHLRKDGVRVFIEGSVTALRNPDGSLRGFLKIGQDVTARKAAEERQALLAREVDHRAKNALAVVQAMLRLTRAETMPAFVRAVEGRVAALARAQTLLAEEHWSGADLHALLQGELAPFLAGQRAELDGPPVALPPGMAQPIAMAVHELATNAVKHGALAVPEGRVAVSWRLEHATLPRLLRLRWVEAGGAPIAGPPERRGFGARVLEGTVRTQLGGVLSLSWVASGLVCEVDLPLRAPDPATPVMA